jgi:uncharacterized membrane protein YbhN (UPF0104 family)
LSTKTKKIIFFSLKLVVSSSLLYFVLSRAGIGRVFTLLRDINPLSFGMSVLIYLFCQLISALRWRLFLANRFPIVRLFRLYLLGSFFNTLLPGLVGGDAVKIYYLYRESGKGTQAMASVFMDRYIGLCSLMVLGICFYPVALKYITGTWVQWLLPLIVLCFITGSVVILGLRFGKRIQFLENIYSYLHSYRRKSGVIAKAFILSLAIQLLMILSVYILGLGLGQNIPLLPFLVFFPIIVAVSTVPISISGLGIREAAFVLLLGKIGVKPDFATAISFAWFLSLASGGLAGLYEYLRESKTPR